MMKSQLGLGVLSIPSVFNTLGIVPGVICLLVVATITTWSDYIVGIFKLNHRSIYSIDDAGGLMFGPIGREVFGFVFCLCKLAKACQISNSDKENRLDFRCWFWNAQLVHRFECCLRPCNLYSRLCSRCSYCGYCICQYSDPWAHQLACVGRSGGYCYGW